MSSIKDRIKAARLPERTVPICLRGDLNAEFEELERQLEEALRIPATSLEGDGSGAIAERMEELRRQMRDETTTFRVRAMPPPRWRAFCAEHPPRKDDEGNIDARDRLLGVNTETFYEALIRVSVIDPVLDDDDWAALLGDGGVLTDRQFSDLAEAAWSVNRREVDVPFSPAASRMTQGSAPE
ncbi:hypothetical protein O7602_26680 [Micromonospora sp. WMMD1128]|uniref:hypothetical protein n=1 Tax=Micromonospora sp. WMMD1128 TaxID=3015150 RepID=UPI00248BEF4B|nr:hypothetical protein [Micromonospora sp. WMMD1128]WBB73230.1 hypothetical protein O7602_26680 [Micromonospora sp. WMMD1128]